MKKIPLKRITVIGLGSAMADMALLLLIFFMATTTSGPPEGGEITLPTALSEQITYEGITLSFTAKRELYFNGTGIAIDRLDRMLKDYDGEFRRILFIGDRELPYREVNVILETVSKNGFHDVVFLTRQAADE